MDQQTTLIILGMSIVTYFPRALPIIVLSKIQTPQWFMRWLRYIPIAVLSALLVPQILISEDMVNISINNKNLIAAIPCFIIAYKTKNLFITVLTGIITMLLLNLI